MKKLFTKLMALVAVLVLSAGSVSAVVHPITNGETFECLQANITGSNWVTYTSANYSSRTVCVSGSIPNLSGNTRTVVFNVSGCASFTIYGDGNSTTRYLSYSINGGTAIQTAAWPNGCSNQTFNTGNTGDITIAISGVSGSVYLGKVVFFTPATPTITAFTAAGVNATINETAKTITAELPYGTNLTAITPSVTVGGTATSYSPTGTQDFSGGAVNYVATDGTPANDITYAVTLTASSVANSDATLNDLMVDGTTVAGFSASTLTYDIALPYAYTGLPTISATANAVTSTKIITQATAIPGSATVVVKAQDNSEKTYTINFTRTPISSSCDITSFTINNKIGVINGTNITVQLHLTTNVASLSPVVNVSQFATYTPSSPVNFSSPVEYIVTAQDGTQKTYTVTVELIDMVYNGTYPYTTNFPSGFIMPNWMSSPSNGIIFTNPYTGSDKGIWYDDETEITAATSSVIRLNSATAMEFYVSKCQTVTVKLSATGSRTFNMYINGNSTPVATSTVSSNTLATLTYSPNLNEPTLIKVDNPSTSGGATLGFFEVTASFGSGLLSNSTSSTLSFDGKTVRNPNSELVHVFDATGRLVVSSTKDVVLSSTAKGIYFVKSNSGNLKIAVK